MDSSAVVHIMGKPDIASSYPGAPKRSKWIYKRGVQINFEDGQVTYVGEIAGYPH